LQGFGDSHGLLTDWPSDTEPGTGGLDAQWTLTCGYGSSRIAWTPPIDLRINRPRRQRGPQ